MDTLHNFVTIVPQTIIPYIISINFYIIILILGTKKVLTQNLQKNVFRLKWI